MNDPRICLLHIRDSIDRIEEYTRDGRDVFLASRLVQDAVIRNFEVICEAVKQVPDDVRARRSDIPWRRIAAFRNFLIHNYMGVVPERVWVVVEAELPNLRSAIDELLGE